MKLSTKTRVARKIGRSKNTDVFLRADFAGLGTPSRITRALGSLIVEGKLVRVGYGVYAKARRSSITGKPVPVSSLAELATQALNALGANPKPGQAQQRYNSGQTTQIPMSISFSVSTRINRRLSLGEQKVMYEKNLS